MIFVEFTIFYDLNHTRYREFSNYAEFGEWVVKNYNIVKIEKIETQ